MTKYGPLQDYLSESPAGQLTLSFSKIEEIIGDSLPESAWTYRAWWANDRSGHSSQTQAWLTADWRVEKVDQVEGRVTFVRREGHFEGGTRKPLETEQPSEIGNAKQASRIIRDFLQEMGWALFTSPISANRTADIWIIEVMVGFRRMKFEVNAGTGEIIRYGEVK
jgi:hypothetical protein